MRHFLVRTAALAALVSLAACTDEVREPPPPRAVKTVVVHSADAPQRMRFAAEVRARHESPLAFQVAGKLRKRHVDLGQRVRAGQLLAEIDPADLWLGELAARAGEQAARAAADQAQAELQRLTRLHEQGFIGDAALDRQQAAALTFRAQWEQARAQSGLRGNQTGHARLTAPADGVVTAVHAEPATVVQAGQPVLTLALDGGRDAVFHVPEHGLAGVRVLVGRDGLIQVRLWGKDDPVPATVREVAASADPLTRTFLVKASVLAPVELGRSAVVEWAVPRDAAHHRVPLAALFERQGRSAVWVLDTQAMTVAARQVQVLGADGDSALIGTGLEPGLEVVTAGVHVLADQQQVVRYAPVGASAPVPAAAGR